MSRPKKIILHIGLPKTGSTSIQQNLRQRDSEIQKYGYLYPSGDIRFPDGHKYNENHSKQLFLLFKQDPEKFGEFSSLNLKNRVLRRAKIKIREALISEIENPALKKIVLSSEALPQLVENELLKLKHFFETHLPECKFEIVLFCRHPLDHAASTFQQNSKFRTNFHPFIVWPYSSILTKFAKVFGKEAISIYKYEDAIEKKEGIVRLFFEKIGLPKEMVEDQDVINASMSQAALNLLTYINSRYPMLDRKSINDSIVTKRCWGRFAEDIRPFISMPGTKFAMDISKLPNFTTTVGYELNWLKENHGISYTLSEPKQTIKNKSIDSEAIKYVVEQFPKLNPFVLKLTYDYFNEMSLDGSISPSVQDELETLLQKLRSKHSILTKTPTSLLGLKEEIKIKLRHVSIKT